MDKIKVYFDNAASTPLDCRVKDIMLQIMEHTYGNPSSIHSFGRETRVIIEKSRRTLSGLLNASPSEIVFTSGATEAINTALNHACKAGIKKIITSPIEHPAVIKTLDYLSTVYPITIHHTTLSPKGEIDLNDLEYALSNDNTPMMVCLMHANNEIGNLLPIKEVSKLCLKYHALFLCDTVQTIGKYPIDLKHIAIDMIVGSAHKFYGPKAAGFLYINGQNKLKPLIFGGGQERDQRAGTENIYGIAGMAEALKLSTEEMSANQEHISKLKTYTVEKLKQLPHNILFNGTCEDSGLYSILNISFPDKQDSDMLMFNLDIEGIAVSGGSACSSGVNNPSHVLTALNNNPKTPSIRLSFSKWNTKKEVDYFIQTLNNHL